MLTSEETLAFKAIYDFITDLGDLYGAQQKSLKLYTRIIKKTQFSNEDAVRKNLKIFTEFCRKNKDAILGELVKESLVQTTISYSERIYVNISLILSLTTPDELKSIRQHLLLLYALLIEKEPVIQVQKGLKELEAFEKKQKKDKEISSLIKDDSTEGKFLKNLVEKVEKTSLSDGNPMTALTDIIQGGMLTDMMAGFKSGNLDLGKLFGAFTDITKSLDQTDPALQQTTSMISGLSSAMEKGGTPDITMLLGMFSQMAPGMNIEQLVQNVPKSS